MAAESRSVRHVTIDDLGKREVAAIRHQVEALGFDAGGFHSPPFEVFPGEFRVRRVFCFLSNRLDRGRAIDGLLGPSHVGQPVQGIRFGTLGERNGPDKRLTAAWPS